MIAHWKFIGHNNTFFFAAHLVQKIIIIIIQPLLLLLLPVTSTISTNTGAGAILDRRSTCTRLYFIVIVIEITRRAKTKDFSFSGSKSTK
jgi:hypothetical protein